MDKTLTQIAEFADTFELASVPVETLDMAKQHLIDSIACGLGARSCAAAEMGRTLSPERPSPDFRGVMLDSGLETSADAAAFTNTAMVRYLDFNDTFPGGHPSDCLGGLIAVAGARDVTGSDVLRAMIVMYEVYNRLTEAGQLRQRGWDQGAAVATAVAAGLGSLLQLGREMIAHAVSLATVACVPMRATRAGELSLWKGAATAEAARQAVFLTSLAAAGMTGPSHPFEGRHGLWDLITGEFELRPFPTEGGPHLMEAVRLKFWPVEYNTQIAVWAAKELREKAAVDEIQSIEVGTYWSTWHETASEPEKWAPTTRETADHSLPYIFARGLVSDGVDLTHFEEEAFTGAAIRRLMDKISVVEDPDVEGLFPEVVSIKVRAILNDGTIIEFSQRNPRGHESNRMTKSETDAKFTQLSPLSAHDAQRALSHWWALESSSSFSESLSLLREQV